MKKREVRFGNGKGGFKDKPCSGRSSGVHEWTTWEGISERDGAHIKATFCKHCGNQP